MRAGLTPPAPPATHAVVVVLGDLGRSPRMQYHALAACGIVSRRRRCRLVVDWHNFGFTLLGSRLPAGHPLLRLAEAYERRAARLADAHLCVSRAMQRVLESEWGARAVAVLYDRPLRLLAPLPPHRRFDVIARLQPDTGAVGSALLVTSTSWTADEDVSSPQSWSSCSGSFRSPEPSRPCAGSVRETSRTTWIEGWNAEARATVIGA